MQRSTVFYPMKSHIPVVLRPQPLTAAAFAPFGDVIESVGHTPMLINDGMTRRYHALAHIELLGHDAHGLLNLFDSTPYAFPLPLTSMERHPLGSQAFVPLQAQPFIVVVAAKGDVPASGLPADALHAFITEGSQGVNYHHGVWHHSLIALSEPARFLVVDRGGAGNNCDVVPIAGPVVLSMQQP